MRNCLFYLALSLFMVSFASTVNAVEKADRITDREIVESLAQIKGDIKSLNQRIDGLDKRIDGLDKRIDGVEKSLGQRIDGLQGLMYVLIGAVIAQTIGIVGFVLWDRRTALAPAIRKTKELEDKLEIAVKKAREVQEKEEKVEKALREYAKKDPELAAILKEVGI